MFSNPSKTEEKPFESTHIPFTKQVRSTDSLILSYLDPDQHEEWAKVKTRNIELQFFVQKPGSKVKETNWDSMIKNLLNVLSMSTCELDPSMYDAKLYVRKKSLYLYIYKDHFEQIKKLITNELAKDKDSKLSPKEEALLQDAIWHYCRNDAEDAGQLLLANIHKADKSAVLNYLINYGATLTAFEKPAKEDLNLLPELVSAGYNVGCVYPDRGILLKAIRFGASTESINNLIIHDAPIVVDNKRRWSQSEAEAERLLFVAAFLCEEETLALLIRKCTPQNLMSVQKELTSFYSKFNSYGPRCSFQLEVDGLSPENILQAKMKLMDAYENAYKKQYPLATEEEYFYSSDINSHLSGIHTLKRGFEFYKNPDTFHGRFLRHYCFDFSKKYSDPSKSKDYQFDTTLPYTPIKINLMEQIQNQLLDVIIFQLPLTEDIEGLVHYREACIQALTHDLFAEEHIKKGVNPKGRRQLEERLAEIKLMLDCDENAEPGGLRCKKRT